MAATIFDRALQAIPGYAEHTAALERLEADAGEVAAQRGETIADILDAAEEALLAGIPVPADLGERIAAADRAERHRAAVLDALGRRAGTDHGTGLYGRLINARANLVREDADDALAVLRAELDEVLDDAKRVDTILGTARSAAEAIAAGDKAAQAWGALDELVARYARLRVAQRRILQRAGYSADGEELGSVLEDAGYLANAIDLDPRWVAQCYPLPPPALGDGGQARLPVDVSGRAVLPPAAWPDPRPTRGGSFFPTGDPQAYLRWLTADPEPDVWLPSRADLTRKRAEMVKEVSARRRARLPHQAALAGRAERAEAQHAASIRLTASASGHLGGR